MLHREIIPGERHALHSWLVADPTALAALTPVAADVGKVALQVAPLDLLLLEEETGPTWVSVLVPAALSTALALAASHVIAIACSDETTNLTTGLAKATFHMPYAFTLVEVIAGLTVAQTAGSIFTVDINEAGSSILSTKLTIDNSEETSLTAATPAVISDTAIAKGAKITVDIDQVGTPLAKGLKVYLVGYRT